MESAITSYLAVSHKLGVVPDVCAGSDDGVGPYQGKWTDENIVSEFNRILDDDVRPQLTFRTRLRFPPMKSLLWFSLASRMQ